ncbi:Piwi domain-containing protein [Chytridium lagenaria]|nr:Piwi domain-containing protein [Chytridium lagenaria]
MGVPMKLVDPGDQLAMELDYKLVLRECARPARPNRAAGTKGRMIRLLANHYGMKIPGTDCYHYDIDIKPETTPPINRCASCYDGRKNLYSPKKMNSDTVIYVDEDDKSEGRQQTFDVTVKLAAVVNMERLVRFMENKGEEEAPRDAIQVLDVLLKYRPSMLFMSIPKTTGASFYAPQTPMFVPEGLNAYQGWKQSIRPTYKQLLLNIDVATSCYYQTGIVHEVVAGFLGHKNIDSVIAYKPTSSKFISLSKFLSNVIVDINYRNTGRRRYKIKRLGRNNATDAKFDVDGRQTTVFRYFADTIGRKLKYPMLPLLCAGASGNILIPMECASVRPGQRHIGKLSDAQTASIIKITAVQPTSRRGKIEIGRRTLHDTDTEGFLKKWGVAIDGNMKEVQARVLKSPSLLCGANAEAQPNNGVFDFSRGPHKFYKAASLYTYGVAVFQGARFQHDNLLAFMKSLLDACKDKGMKVADRDWNRVVLYQEGRTVEQTLAEANAYAKNGITPVEGAGHIIFCVIDRPTGLYEEIKLVAETRLNIMTQCFQAKHCDRSKPGLVVNLALKINAKLGGVNLAVEPKANLNVLGQPIPTMIMGADVTHPPPGADGGVSIAAVAASMDSKFAEYRAAIRVQPPRKEIIGDLGGMFRELGNQFREKAGGRSPQRVIFYRDGVSEGQFAEVALHEVQSLKKAFRELGVDIKLTFVVVNKRHGTRFFVKDPADADRSGNIPPGTVVDTGIVHPFEFDFFLNSHPGLQGTSRAAHYHVLYDENKFNPDDLQEITYRMCYLYARATRAVSIVPPAYYAHLVAARARCFRPGGTGSDTVSMMSGGSGGGGITAESFFEVTPAMRKTFYFT